MAAAVAVVVGYQQIADERDARKASEQRLARNETREQAEKISAWIKGDTEAGMPAILANRSDQPVYEVIAYRVAAYGGAAHTGREIGERFGEFRTFSILPPGKEQTVFDPGWHAMGLRPGVEIAFRTKLASTGSVSLTASSSGLIVGPLISPCAMPPAVSAARGRFFVWERTVA